MKAKQKSSAAVSSSLDLDTIRARVQAIKSTWTPEMMQQRAEEGKRRRAELENLLLGTYLCCAASHKSNFSLVG